MKDLRHIFESFSKRNPPSTNPLACVIPDSTRNRVLLWCSELFDGLRPSEYIGRGSHRAEFWQEEYRRLLYRTGRLTLTAQDTGNDPRQAIAYVLQCPGGEFLNFLEDIFSDEVFVQVNSGDKNIVDELNELLRQDNVLYSVTYFAWDTVQETSGHFAGHTTIHVRAYPKVISKESETMHKEAIQPALQVLAAPYFAAANKEYLAALEDYRKGDIGDCLVKCGSAFESVLKVICDRRGWPYSQTDVASTLVRTIIGNTSLDNYFEPLLIIIATLRNRMSTAHGAGITTKQPPRHLAHYALNITASAMLMLAQEAGV